MKHLFLILCLYPTLLLAEVPLPRASTGLEVGVARLSDGHKSLIGTSWMFVMDYRPDKYLSFFGQAGASQGEDKGYRIKQTSFNGGIQLYLLPLLAFQLGVATTVIESGDEKIKRENEVGPLTGLNLYYPVGVFKIGTSATFIRTKTVHSTALRGMVMIEF